MKWLWDLITANWQERLILVAITLALVVGVHTHGYYAGKASVVSEEAKVTIKTVEKVRVVHDKVSAMPAGAVHDELRVHWQRQ